MFTETKDNIWIFNQKNESAIWDGNIAPIKG